MEENPDINPKQFSPCKVGVFLIYFLIPSQSLQSVGKEIGGKKRGHVAHAQPGEAKEKGTNLQPSSYILRIAGAGKAAQGGLAQVGTQNPLDR